MGHPAQPVSSSAVRRSLFAVAPSDAAANGRVPVQGCGSCSAELISCSCKQNPRSGIGARRSSRPPSGSWQSTGIRGQPSRIVEAGGLSSPGLISYHFADRAELLESVYRYVADLRHAANDRALAGITDPVGRLRTALRTDTEFFAARPELFAAVVEAFHGLRDPAGRLKYLGETRSEDRMLELLRAAAGQAGLPPKPTSAASPSLSTARRRSSSHCSTADPSWTSAHSSARSLTWH